MQSPAVTVRMYNVGFGDAFLVSVGEGSQVWRMLVDCGVHSQGRSEHHIDDVVADIVAVAADRGGSPRLDVVVGTHRHRDHVLGFEDDRWQTVEVGEVWLPWVEDPDNKEAVLLRESHDAAAKALHLSLAAMDEPTAALALNSLTNERAMWTLRHGFAGNPARRYVAADLNTARELPGLPGASVRFLGPPRDEAALKAMEPPKSQRWFSMSTGTPEPEVEGSPFPPEFVLDTEVYTRRFTHLKIPDKLLKRLELDEDDAFAAATWLDRSINNTSVFFLLQLGDARLLFPGDAQWGAWQPLLDAPAIRALLAGVSLYKVSHHGSHNGTPTSLARELLSHQVTSMLSVRPIERWKSVPKEALVTELGGHTRHLISSAEAAPHGVRGSAEGLWVEFDVAT